MRADALASIEVHSIGCSVFQTERLRLSTMLLYKICLSETICKLAVSKEALQKDPVVVLLFLIEPDTLLLRTATLPAETITLVHRP